MSNVISKVKMRTPNCSAFPFSFRNRFTSRIGELTPVACIEMGPNDRLKMSMAHLSRLMPMSAPAMANFRLDVDAVFVPSRIVAKKYERFFNPATPDDDRPFFPSLTYHQYSNVLIDYVGFFNKSLLDYLGYPTFENVKDFYRNMITTFKEVSGDYVKAYYVPEQTVKYSSPNWLGAFYSIVSGDDNTCYDDHGIFTKGEDGDTVSGAFWYLKSSNNQVYDLLTWIVCTDNGFNVSAATAKSYFLPFLSKYGLAKQPIPGSEAYVLTHADMTQGNIVETWLNANNKVLPDVLDEYFSYCVKSWNSANTNAFLSDVYTLPSYRTFEQLLYYKDDAQMSKSLLIRDKKLSLLPVFSFWKCYFDWYVNSVLEHGEELTEAWSYLVQAIIDKGEIELPNFTIDEYEGSASFDTVYAEYIWTFFDVEEGSNLADFLFKIPARLWAIDRFTGAYTDTQNGNPVLIPVDGTIRDITASNVLQRLLTKELFGGTRTIDKNEIIYGAKSSNQLLDRTEVLCRKKFNIDIQQVTNSAKSDEFDLGTLGGNGFGMGSDFLFDYTCEERGTVLIFASVVLPPSYVQAMDRCLMHTDFYDFVLPEFDQIGEQEIAPEELYFDKGMNFAPVGYNRRYYENIDMLSSVHGDFKNTLRYWHDARFFKDAPSLSPEFIRIDPENDDLERIFATYNHDQILNFFAFSGVVVRPMSKYVQYGTL